MRDPVKPKLIVIAGPTAVGKSACAVSLCEAVGGEVVSADSMQVYRGMDIGTAKITPDEMRGIPHHLIDVMDPRDDYSVVLFQSMAKTALSEIYARGKIPVLCGGTGFYIQALLYGISFPEETDTGDADAALCRLQDEAGRAEGDPALFLHDALRTLDPLSAETIPPSNQKRVLRALRFYLIHNKTISSHNQEQASKRSESAYDYRYFVLTDQRKTLYEHINQRVDRMMEQGFLREVQALLDAGVRRESTAMQGIGYRELSEAISGVCSVSDAVSRIKQNSRHYAKRQLTWFRREGERVCWIDRSRCTDPSREILRTLSEEQYL